MILDTHCHFDMMPNPEKYIKDAENMHVMTCIECGIRMQQVDTEAISQGYQLAFPGNKEKLEEWLRGEDEYRDW